MITTMFQTMPVLALQIDWGPVNVIAILQRAYQLRLEVQKIVKAL